ncbi:hypothetical protein [Streptomyces sp. NPDC057554]|uniref:hypothetical protein n=1 Tax=Streptomyces sp. NPDC057554 TaxID=3350538 RepID=UPI0036C827E1
MGAVREGRVRTRVASAVDRGVPVVDRGVPVVVRRLVAHEFRALHSLGLWTVRRRHRLPEGARPFPYTEPQTGTMWVFFFVSVLETVVLALVIPWPLVHQILLVTGVYGVLFVISLHASCVTRPHLVERDGSLRLRYGALFDLRVPATVIASVRVERCYSGSGIVRVGEDGSLDLVVAGQTTVVVELTEGVEYVRPLGRRGTARTLRFHADDPRAMVAALVESAAPLTPERTAPTSPPGPPA